MRPADTAIARAQWTLVLSRFRTHQVALIHEQRDLAQLQQLSTLGFLQASDKRPLAMDPQLGQALARLANHTTQTKPLVLLSLYRTRQSYRPREPHSNGLAVDISAFAGHTIDNHRPAEALAAAIAILRMLPPGRYRLGLPKPPNSDPKAFLPPPPRARNWPFFPAPVPLAGQIGPVSLVLPRTRGRRLEMDGPGVFRPAIARWAERIVRSACGGRRSPTS